MAEDGVMTAELAAKISSLLPSIAWTSTVPIMMSLDETLQPNATGSLFRVGDAHFLVTAAHVLEMAKEYGAKVTIGVAGHQHPMKPGGNSFKAEDESLDIAIWRLDKKAVELLSGNTFLGLADVYTPSKYEDDFYFVCGFPCEHASKAMKPGEIAQNAPLQFCTTFFDGDMGEAPGFSAKYHVLLDAGREYMFRGEGAARDFPNKVFGFSGCTIWTAKAMGKPRESWKPGQAKLTAIQTCAYSKGQMHKILRGTKWAAVNSLIVAVFPELRPSFDIVYA